MGKRYWASRNWGTGIEVEGLERVNWGRKLGRGVQDEQGMGRLEDNGIEGETVELEQENPSQEKTK